MPAWVVWNPDGSRWGVAGTGRGFAKGSPLFDVLADVESGRIRGFWVGAGPRIQH